MDRVELELEFERESYLKAVKAMRRTRLRAAALISSVAFWRSASADADRLNAEDARRLTAGKLHYDSVHLSKDIFAALSSGLSADLEDEFVSFRYFKECSNQNDVCAIIRFLVQCRNQRREQLICKIIPNALRSNAQTLTQAQALSIAPDQASSEKHLQQLSHGKPPSASDKSVFNDGSPIAAAEDVSDIFDGAQDSPWPTSDAFWSPFYGPPGWEGGAHVSGQAGGEMGKISPYTPITPPAPYWPDLDIGIPGESNPFLSLLPTLKPPPLQYEKGKVPFEDWLSRVKLPPNVRAKASGYDLLRALESKSLEIMLSAIRVPVAFTAASTAFIPPTLPPAPTLPPLPGPSLLLPGMSPAILDEMLTEEGLLEAPLPQLRLTESSPTASFLRLAGLTDPHTSFAQSRKTHDKTHESYNRRAENDPATGGDNAWHALLTRAQATGHLKRQAFDNGSVDPSRIGLDTEKPLSRTDYVLGSRQHRRAVESRAPAQAQESTASLRRMSVEEPVSSDMLPWVPVDDIVGTLPSWLLESLVGPYALMFQDMVQFCQDSFIRMQLVFDALSDEPIPVTASGIADFSEQIAKAFRAAPEGSESTLR